MNPLNQRRLSDISFVIDSELKIKYGNRAFNKAFFTTSASDIHILDYLSEFDSKNLQHFLKNFPDDGESHAFLTKLNIHDKSISCICTISKTESNDFSVILEELSYSRELLDKALLESREFKALLQNFDNYYFIFNGKSFSIKNTKDLNNVFEGNLEEFSNYLKNTFKLNLTHNDTNKQFEAMLSDIVNFETNKFYNFLQQDKKLFTIHTIKTSTRKNTMIVGSITTGKKSGTETNLYTEQKDGLTGLYNKKSITELAITKINKDKMPCTLIIIDVDKFKECNDNYGHIFGDRVLVAVSSCIKDAIQGVGIAGRIGGDEFMVLLDRTKEEDIRNVTRNIRTAIQWSITNVEPGSSVTCSMGIASFPANSPDYDQLFALADKCLYLAKYRGRNCYIIYKPELHDKLLIEKTNKENELASGKFFMHNADTELKILNTLMEKKGDFLKDSLNLLLDYMKVNKITVYNSNFDVAFTVGSDEINIRKNYFDDKYFSFFNDYSFLHLDNTNILDSIDSDRYYMYASNEISSTIEVLGKDEDGNNTSLVCYDLYKPARTFPKEKVTFAIMAAKLISNYI